MYVIAKPIFAHGHAFPNNNIEMFKIMVENGVTENVSQYVYTHMSLHKEWSFSLRASSVNVTRSAGKNEHFLHSDTRTYVCEMINV